MTGRGLRVRAPVNYNDKTDMEPAWLKSIGGTKTQSPKKPRKKASTSKGSAEKENSGKEKKTATKSKNAKQEKHEDDEVLAAPTEKKTKPKKSLAKEDKPAPQAARGRNAGLTVVPIADKKTKTPHVSGLRKPETVKPAAVPKAPAAPKEVPGLPGVVQKAAKSPAARPSSGKRKAPSSATTPSDAGFSPTPVKHQASFRRAIPPSGDTLSIPPVGGRSSKRSRHQAPIAAVAVNLPPSPELFSFSPLPPPSNLEKQLEESQRNFAELQTLYETLQEENTALKTASIREQVEELFAQHTERVLEHGEKASALAAHWREEAERMAAKLVDAKVEEVYSEAQRLRTELATARQALLDAHLKETEKDKAMVELQKRNQLLERYARKKPQMVNRCIGTDDANNTMSFGIQAPSTGMNVNQARAMAPEGAVGSSMYRGYYPAQYQQQQQKGGLGVDAPYSLINQRTIAPDGGRNQQRIISGSDMDIAAGNNNLTAESVQARGGGRRVSAPPAPIHLNARPGQTAAEVSRQIHFYSNSLSAVPEEDEPVAAAAGAASMEVELQHQQQQYASQVPPPSTGPMLSNGMAMMVAAHFQAQPLKGGKFRYTHQKTGLSFILGNLTTIDPDSPEITMVYQPISFGSVEDALNQVSGGVLMEEFEFADDGVETIWEFVMKAIRITGQQQQ